MNDYEFIDGTRLSSVIEAYIFTSSEPIAAQRICELISQGEEHLQLEPEAIPPFVEKLNQRYEENGLAFSIIEIAGGYSFATRDRLDPWLSIFQHEDAYSRLSQSAIETLAIVAYKQPVTKPEIDDIRGVNSGYMLRQLLEKVLIEVGGRLDAPGRPLLYKTSPHFLKHFGINTIDELPKPREIEEILTDDDMTEHRQFLFDRQLELEDLETEDDNTISLLDAVEKIDDKNTVGKESSADKSSNNNADNGSQKDI